MVFSKISTYIAGAIILFFLFLGWAFSAPNSFPKGTIVNIEKGESLRGVSFSLKEKHLIRSRVTFETLVILLGGEKHILQGDYLFEEKSNIFEVAKRIAFRDRRLASVKLTIPEGFDTIQIANMAVDRLKNFNKEKFLALAKEGYLFPDTYFFFSTDTEREVIDYMADNFEKKIIPLEHEIISFGKGKGNIITMASIIEREAKGEADRGYISGILWKRIKIGMALQADAAPETYKEKGLPDGPICNPGLLAIKASIHPVNSPYLYYLHDKNGEVHYARTFEEHKANKLKYLK